MSLTIVPFQPNDAEEANAAAAASTPWVLLGTPEVLISVAVAESSLPSDPRIGALVRSADVPDWWPYDPWEWLPAMIAWMLVPASPEGPVLARPSLIATAPFQSSASPVWLWTLRACITGTVLRLPEKSLRDSDDASAYEVSLPELTPLSPHPSQSIAGILKELIPEAVPRTSPDATALAAGLWLWHDFLDESHRLSQSIEGDGRHRAGDYWHAIMHRREGDYSNSKYWYRRVGRHPIFGELAECVRTLVVGSAVAEEGLEFATRGDWDPFAFVDLCAACARAGNDATTLTARKIQQIEMLLLMRQTVRDAAG